MEQRRKFSKEFKMGSLTNEPSADNLAPTIPATGIALLAFLLAAQLLVEATTSDFIGVDMAIDGLAANTDLISNLDGAPLP
jgi:hypothetical protein